ncbi:acyl-coenzyme A thioesterase 9, mitochondrial-like isoform X2 [Narcine bancroftii]|uniref:acyl-coenzyme A thioesterase 9, mitochondrial-like isoform X2 n=1 Tax=Narcine bancroftii TaxID=1343680 RepID=UPI003832277E
MYLRARYWLLRSISSVLNKPCNLLSARYHTEGCCPELTEGESKLLMTDVRAELQKIVGASVKWSEHLQSTKERASLSSLLVESQDSLPCRHMKDSYLEAYLPLGSQLLLREKYLNVHNLVRFGRILEDLDSFGVLISYKHTKTDSPQSHFSIVTALVDEIDLVKDVILPDCDMKFTGHVTWVGKSSMEVQMHVSQFQHGSFNPILQATFVMVARDPSNKRAAFVNPLKLMSPEEENLFEQGKLNKARRTTIKETSLLRTAPNEDERKIVHEMFLETLDAKTVSFRSRILPKNSVWMEDTKLKSLEICHPQVCYTKGNYIQVRVHSTVVDPVSKDHHTTNIFHFTFGSEKDVMQVFPKSYGESMLYLDGKRHFKARLSNEK